MENTSSIDFALQTALTSRQNSKESHNPGARSRRKSKSSSGHDPDTGATNSVGSNPPAIEGALSLLQSLFDQALETGLKAKVYQASQTPTPVLILELHGVTLCPTCQMWTLMNHCSICTEEANG